MDNYKYIVYGLNSCPFCVEAVSSLKERKLNYVYAELTKTPEFLREVKEFYDHSTIPIVLRIDSESGKVELIGGCDDLKESYVD
jgi:glutaredoxin